MNPAKYTLALEAPLIACGDDGGFDVAYADEETAVAIFRAWHRAEVARIAGEYAALAARSRLRLVRTGRDPA